MKTRILMLLTVVALGLAILAMSVAPAFARGCPFDPANTAFNASKGRCFRP
jgi:hypothetical protein